MGLGPLGVCCFTSVLCCQGFCTGPGQGGLNCPQSHAAAVNTGQDTARGSSQCWGQGCNGLPRVVARAQPCPSSTPLSFRSFSLAPGPTSHPTCSGWLVLLPQTPLGCAAGTCRAVAPGARLCVCLRAVLPPAMALPWGQGGSCPQLPHGQAWVPRGAGAHSTQTCRCLGCACYTSPLGDVAWLLSANPPLLCAKMQNILIHDSLSCFFSFPC